MAIQDSSNNRTIRRGINFKVRGSILAVHIPVSVNNRISKIDIPDKGRKATVGFLKSPEDIVGIVVKGNVFGMSNVVRVTYVTYLDGLIKDGTYAEDFLRLV